MTLRDKVLKYLAFRPRSEREVRDYLKRKGSDEKETQALISQLRDEHLIDDAKFLAWYVESRSRASPRGRRLLTWELKQKGIAAQILNLDEEELASRALEKKWRLWSRLPRRDFSLKAGRFLAGRGFAWETIAQVVKKAYNRSPC